MTHANAPLTPEGRLRLVRRCQHRPIAHVAAEAAVSRQCLSKWVKRYREHGEPGLQDASSAPASSPSATPQHVVDRIIVLRKKKWSARRTALAVDRLGEGGDVPVRPGRLAVAERRVGRDTTLVDGRRSHPQPVDAGSGRLGDAAQLVEVVECLRLCTVEHEAGRHLDRSTSRIGLFTLSATPSASTQVESVVQGRPAGGRWGSPPLPVRSRHES